MTRKSKSGSEQLALLVNSDVVRQIRQHARSSTNTEVCGVLIGREAGHSLEIDACIAGLNAAQAGTHVTFTQDTWEHIYKIRDKDYPEQKIVGWYHSHPGFGVFLSDHDTFIHKNFFSSPQQVAWVYDPHSDEEGCFGWVGARIERLSRISISDPRGGERAEQTGNSGPKAGSEDVDPEPMDLQLGRKSAGVSLQKLTTAILSYLAVLLLGFLLSRFLFPRIVVLPVPVDPQTGQILRNPFAAPPTASPAPDGLGRQPDR